MSDLKMTASEKITLEKILLYSWIVFLTALVGINFDCTNREPVVKRLFQDQLREAIDNGSFDKKITAIIHNITQKERRINASSDDRY